jgi:hypothetical protein
MVQGLENSCGAHHVVAETIRVRGSRIPMARLGMQHRDEIVSGVVGGAKLRVDTFDRNPEANQERIQHQEGEVRMATEAVSLVVVHLQA